METNLNTRFIKKYPNGWVVQGNDNSKWKKFCDVETNVGGRDTDFYYHTNFKKYGRKIDFDYLQSKTYKKQIISVDEFFDLYEGKESEQPIYEIY